MNIPELVKELINEKIKVDYLSGNINAPELPDKLIEAEKEYLKLMNDWADKRKKDKDL